MTDKNLRTLAKDYSEGKLNKDGYRREREKLLAGILAGTIEVEDNHHTTFLDTSEQEHAIPKDSPQAEEHRFIPGVSRSNIFPAQNLYLVGGAVLVVLSAVIIVIYMLIREPESTFKVDAMINTVPAITEETYIVPDTYIIEDLIQRFIQNNDWSENSRQAFLENWETLSPEEKEQALALPISNQLANLIYEQLIEQRALYQLGDRENSLINQKILVDFAWQIGIDDPRITVKQPEQPAPIETESNGETTVAPGQAAESSQDELTIFAEPPDKSGEQEPAVETKGEPAVTAAEPSVTVQQPDPVRTAAMAIKTQTPVSKYACYPSLARQRKPYCRDNLGELGKGPTLAVIPEGKYLMGGELENEQPVHEVVIDTPFAITVHEISQADYLLFCQDTDRQCPAQPWSDREYPVVNISWDDAVSYSKWLSEKTGMPYRLPTEAEWEYAARAGSQADYPTGDKILISDAVFTDIKELTSPLPKSDRSVNRNKFRLYHMLGNVREWVLDPWNDSHLDAPGDGSARVNGDTNYRVVRGGSFADNMAALRSSAREKLPTNNKDIYTGFRVIQELN